MHLRTVEKGGEKVAADSHVGPGGLEDGGAEAAAPEEESEAMLSRVPLYQQVEKSSMSALTWLFVLVSPVLVIFGISLDVFSIGMPGCFLGGLKWTMGGDVVSDYSIVAATASFP